MTENMDSARQIELDLRTEVEAAEERKLAALHAAAQHAESVFQADVAAAHQRASQRFASLRPATATQSRPEPIPEVSQRVEAPQARRPPQPPAPLLSPEGLLGSALGDNGPWTSTELGEMRDRRG